MTQSDDYTEQDRVWISVSCASGLKNVSVFEAEVVSDRLMEEYGATTEVSRRVAFDALAHLRSVADRMKVELLYQEDVSRERYAALETRIHRGLTAAEASAKAPEMSEISRSYPTGELAYDAPPALNGNKRTPGRSPEKPAAKPRTKSAPSTTHDAVLPEETVHIPKDYE